jgi:hypothetical protein
MIHGGVAGEHMGGQIHQEGYQAISLGSSFDHQHGQASNGSETERAKKGKAHSVSEPISAREDRAIIAQFRQGIPYKDMSNHIDILNKRSASTLRYRFEEVLERRMNPSEAKRLREERAQNMELMEQKFKKEPLSVQTEEKQCKVHNIILRNLSSFPKCSYCFTE